MRGKRKLAFIIVAILLVCSAAVAIGLTVRFVSDIKKPSDVITNGQLLNIEEARVYEIYCESSSPPKTDTYDFSFTNIETNEIVSSFSTTQSKTYSIDTLVINSEIKGGRFGRLVALVELDAGAYTIHFTPPADTSVFVWGNESFSILLKYAVSLIPTLIILFLLIVCLVLIAVIKTKEKGNS